MDGMIDPVDANRRLAAFQNPVKQAFKAVADPPTSHPPHRKGASQQTRTRLADELLRARIKVERESGLISELERKRRQAELVDADEVKNAMQLRLAAEREALIAWPLRVSADMAAELGVNERLFLEVQQKYIREFLTEHCRVPTL